MNNNNFNNYNWNQNYNWNNNNQYMYNTPNYNKQTNHKSKRARMLIMYIILLITGTYLALSTYNKVQLYNNFKTSSIESLHGEVLSCEKKTTSYYDEDEHKTIRNTSYIIKVQAEDGKVFTETKNIGYDEGDSIPVKKYKNIYGLNTNTVKYKAVRLRSTAVLDGIWFEVLAVVLFIGIAGIKFNEVSSFRKVTATIISLMIILSMAIGFMFIFGQFI